MKGISYMVVTWEGEGEDPQARTYHGERKFYNYKEAYRFCQEHLKNLAQEEYQIDDPEHYYAPHHFLCCELWRLTLKENVFEEKYYEKERVFFFYWTGRRVTYSSGKKEKFTFERVAKIEEALKRGDKEEAEELTKSNLEAFKWQRE